MERLRGRGAHEAPKELRKTRKTKQNKNDGAKKGRPRVGSIVQYKVRQ